MRPYTNVLRATVVEIGSNRMAEFSKNAYFVIASYHDNVIIKISVGQYLNSINNHDIAFEGGRFEKR